MHIHEHVFTFSFQSHREVNAMKIPTPNISSYFLLCCLHYYSNTNTV